MAQQIGHGTAVAFSPDPMTIIKVFFHDAAMRKLTSKSIKVNQLISKIVLFFCCCFFGVFFIVIYHQLASTCSQNNISSVY